MSVSADALAWLEAVESLADRRDDAQLALAALGLRRHPGVFAIVGRVLTELARRSQERAEAVVACGNRTATAVGDEGAELAELLASGWAVLAGLNREEVRQRGLAEGASPSSGHRLALVSRRGRHEGTQQNARAMGLDAIESARPDGDARTTGVVRPTDAQRRGMVMAKQAAEAIDTNATEQTRPVKTAADWCELSPEVLRGMRLDALSEDDRDWMMAVAELELLPVDTADEAAPCVVDALDHELAALRRRVRAMNEPAAQLAAQLDRACELAAGLVRNWPGRRTTRSRA